MSLTPKDRLAVKKAYANGMTQQQLANAFAVSPQAISKIVAEPDVLEAWELFVSATNDLAKATSRYKDDVCVGMTDEQKKASDKAMAKTLGPDPDAHKLEIDDTVIEQIQKTVKGYLDDLNGDSRG